MNPSLSLSLGFPDSFFPFDDVISPFNDVIATRSKNSLRNVLFPSSNVLFSRFFKVCHKISCMDCLRTFRKNVCDHRIGIALVNAAHEKIQQITKMGDASQ